jgi:hypothetical protein
VFGGQARIDGALSVFADLLLGMNVCVRYLLPAPADLVAQQMALSDQVRALPT